MATSDSWMGIVGAWACSAVFVAISGCGSGKGRPPVYATEGKLSIGGKTPAGAWIVLHRTDEKQPFALKPFGKVGGDGSFSLQTFTAGDGAPAGSYAVTVTWPGPPSKNDPDAVEGPDQLRGKYADPKKPAAEISIHPEKNHLGEISLKP
ncbi:MAG: hypothetical protein K2X38_03075 [Gemmataceae bacterium]|nr:hypothetical protein [Gemmataceae bacterium]